MNFHTTYTGCDFLRHRQKMAVEMRDINTKPPTAIPIMAPVPRDTPMVLRMVEGATVGAPVGEAFTTDGAALADMPAREG
jgi:hypothetical protein